MITKDDVGKILEKYNLGKVGKIKVVKGGIINYNFDVETEKGRFIVRFMGSKMKDHNRKKFDLKFEVLDYLNNKDFPYKVPVPIKNKVGRYLTRIGEKHAWVYERIHGQSIPKLNEIQIKELTKATSVYSKFVSKRKWKFKVDDYKWLLEKYLRMKKVKGKRSLDKMMLENIDFFEKTFLEWKKKPFNKNIVPIHSDLHQGNVLFDGDKIIAILDFGNIKVSSRVRDVAYLVRTFCFDGIKLNRTKMNALLKEYDKVSPLSKKEKTEIIRFIIQFNCIVFWWTYEKMNQAKRDKYSTLKWIIDTTKELVKTKEWRK